MVINHGGLRLHLATRALTRIPDSVIGRVVRFVMIGEIE